MFRWIYCVEDDENISAIVKQYIEQKGYRVQVYDTIGAAKQAIQKQIPALVLMDWNMPDGSGDDLCRWIRGTWNDLPIIFITVRGDSRDIVAGFGNGADDYVVKPFELDVLYSRIQALLRRAGNVSGRYLSCGSISLDKHRMTVVCENEEVALSSLEYELLLRLMENKGRIVAREALLSNIWDVNGNYVNDNTLTVAVKRLREKLRNPSCIKTVRSIGYRMEDTI